MRQDSRNLKRALLHLFSRLHQNQAAKVQSSFKIFLTPILKPNSGKHVESDVSCAGLFKRNNLLATEFTNATFCAKGILLTVKRC